jgi:hypothetical protein
MIENYYKIELRELGDEKNNIVIHFRLSVGILHTTSHPDGCPSGSFPIHRKSCSLTNLHEDPIDQRDNDRSDPGIQE